MQSCKFKYKQTHGRGLLSSLLAISTLNLSPASSLRSSYWIIFSPDSPSWHEFTSQSEFGRIRKQAVQSRISGDEFASRIMVAQRHYSALATTVVVTASPEKQGDFLTVNAGIGMEKRKSVLSNSSHLRSRSVSSIMVKQSAQTTARAPVDLRLNLFLPHLLMFVLPSNNRRALPSTGNRTRLVIASVQPSTTMLTRSTCSPLVFCLFLYLV